MPRRAAPLGDGHAVGSRLVARQTLWIGTYPPAGIGTPPGRGEGVYRLDLDPATGALGDPRRVVETPAPSFVAWHPTAPVLYATDESEQGRVAAFRIDGDRLVALGTASSGGAFPCHLLVDGDLLYAANYGDGALGVLRLAGDGSLSDEPQVLRHAGSGPVADRQGGSHAHFAVRAPGGHVLVVDLGTDQVRRYRRTSSGLEPAGIAAMLPPGTGPRHLVFRDRSGDAPDGKGGRLAYLTGELDSTVHVLAWDPSTDTGEPVQTLPALGFAADPARRPVADPPGRYIGAGPTGGPVDPAPDHRPGGSERRDRQDRQGRRDQRDQRDVQDVRDLRAAWVGDATPSPSHLALAGDELVVGVRGAGALSRFAVGPDGLLAHRADQPLPGPVPRHFAVVGRWTVVAEQVPGAVTVLDRDGAVVSARAVPSAACVMPAP